MKKIMLIAAISLALFSQSFAGTLNHATMTGWPNNVTGFVGSPSSAYRIVKFGSFYYAKTDDQGIYRTSNLVSGSWSSINTGLPAAGVASGTPYYTIHDMDICGNYLYVVCNTSTAGSAPLIYRMDLTAGSPTFGLVSSTSALINGRTYHVRGVKTWVYIAGETSAGGATADIYGHDPTSGFPMLALTISPGGTSPAECYSMNAGKTSLGYDLHFPCSNGLFCLPLDNSGVPSGSATVNTSITQCTAIDYVYNTGTGNYATAYLIQLVFVSGHLAPSQISKVAWPATGSPTTITTSYGSGTIASIGTMSNTAHFGLLVSGSSSTNALYISNPLFTSFSTSCGAVSSSGIVSTYNDGSLLIMGSFLNGLYYPSATSCKTDATTGIDDVEADQINVYPVPATNELTISYAASEGAQPVITLYDLQGRQQSVYVDYSQNEAKINTSSLSKGVYLLEYNNGTKTTKRVVID